MTLSSAYIELFIRGKSPGGKCPDTSSACCPLTRILDWIGEEDENTKLNLIRVSWNRESRPTSQLLLIYLQINN